MRALRGVERPGRGSWVVRLLIVLACGLAAAPAPAGEGPGVKEDAEAEARIAAARQAFDQFQQAGKAAVWESSAARREVEGLWDYGRKHRASAGGIKATATALRLLDRLGRRAEFKEKVETLAANDRAWGEVMLVLLWSADASGDWSLFVAKAQWLTAESPDVLLRAKLWFTLGRYYRSRDQLRDAEAAFGKSAALSPEPELAASAKGMVYELQSLGRGQPAPEFSAPLLSGGAWSLAKQRGKVVVLDFWGTACAQCEEEFAQLERLRQRLAGKGVELLGISVDTACDRARATVARHALTWPQACDGKAVKGEAARLYNADEVPAYYVVDRDGVIVGSKVKAEELGDIVDEALRAAPPAPAP